MSDSNAYFKDGEWRGGSLQYKAGQFLIRFADGATSDEKERILEATHGILVGSVGGCGWTLIQIDTAEDVPAVVEQVVDSPQVRSAEPLVPIEIDMTFNDSAFPSQWAWQNFGRTCSLHCARVSSGIHCDSDSGIIGSDCRISEALDVASPADSVVFGWIDCGISVDTAGNLTHPDLLDTFHIVPLINYTPFGDSTNLSDSCLDCPYEAPPHGTATVSIAAATRDNDIGMAGICPEARFLIIKGMSYSPSSTQEDVIDALSRAIDEGVNVVNFSGAFPPSVPPSGGLEDEIERACNAGVLFVTITGNDTLNLLRFPGGFASAGTNEGHTYGYRNVIAVGATDCSDSLVIRSGCKREIPDSWPGFEADSVEVSVVAPGASIVCAWFTPGYREEMGTSLAAPHVSGLAGLLKAKQPSLTADSIRAIIENTADKIWLDSTKGAYDPSWPDSNEHDYYGKGRVNFLSALLAIELQGVYTSDATWSGTETIRSDVIIDSGVTVTVDAGTILRIRDMDSYYYEDEVDTNRVEIIVKGTLIADASAGNPISFEPHDSVSGDTAAWYGIRVLDQGRVVFRNVQVSNAFCGIDLNSEAPDEVYSCEFINNTQYGIYCRNDSAATESTVVRKNTIEKDSAASYTGYGIRIAESSLIDSNTVKFYNFGIWANGDSPWIVYNTIHCAGMGVVVRSTDDAKVWCNKFTGEFARAIEYWHANVNTQANIICPDTTNGNDGCGYGLYFGPWGDGEVWNNRFFNCHAAGALVLGSYPDFGDDEETGGNWFRVPDSSALALTSSTSIFAERCLWQYNSTVLDSASKIAPWVDGSVDYEPFSTTVPTAPTPVPYDPDQQPDTKRAFAAADDARLPHYYALEQNYPNPFNPTTLISYALPERALVRLSIYNMLGQHVVDLVNGVQPPGYHQAQWDGIDKRGSNCASGVYLYKIKAEHFSESRKMLLLK